jgi:hypothetical protein
MVCARNLLGLQQVTGDRAAFVGALVLAVAAGVSRACPPMSCWRTRRVCLHCQVAFCRCCCTHRAALATAAAPCRRPCFCAEHALVPACLRACCQPAAGPHVISTPPCLSSAGHGLCWGRFDGGSMFSAGAGVCCGCVWCLRHGRRPGDAAQVVNTAAGAVIPQR